MYRDKERYGQEPTKVLRSAKATFRKPLTWKEPAMVFTCSWSDFFIEEADEWRKDAWEIIKATPHLTYQILTKRSERIIHCLPDDWGDGYPNVWLGVSAENQEMYDERIWYLTKPDLKAKVKFLSLEPLLGPIHLSYDEPVDWVIVGGESGNDKGKYKYRPSELTWYKHIIDQCNAYKIAVFVKQLGTHLAKELYLKARHGGDLDEWPAQLQIRAFPNAR